MDRILIGYPLQKYPQFDDMLAALKKHFVVVLKDYDARWLEKNIASYNILIPSLTVPVTDRVIQRAVSLRLIFTPTTGIDHLQFDKRGKRFKVFSLADFPNEIKAITATSELAFSLILALSRNIVPASLDVVWHGKWRRNSFIGNELQGKTLGILGLGRIGNRVALYGKSFGMRIIYWDISGKNAPWERKRSREGLFRESDYVVCALPLNPKTRNCVNRRNARSFKKGSFFINISRGDIVDERALCEALERGRLSGVASDVLKTELSDHKRSLLYRYAKAYPRKNIVITPHIGGATLESWQKTFSLVVEKILNNKV